MTFTSKDRWIALFGFSVVMNLSARERWPLPGEGRPSPRDPLWLPPFVPHPGTSVEADERGVAYRRHGIGAAPSLSMKSTRDLLAISITTPLRTERSNPGCSAATWYAPGNQERRRVLTHLVG